MGLAAAAALHSALLLLLGGSAGTARRPRHATRAQPTRLALSPEDELKRRIKEEVREFTEAQLAAAAATPTPTPLSVFSAADAVLLPAATAIVGRAILVQRKAQAEQPPVPPPPPPPLLATLPPEPAVGARRSAIISLCAGGAGLLVGTQLASRSPPAPTPLPAPGMGPFGASQPVARGRGQVEAGSLFAEARASAKRVAELEAQLEAQQQAATSFEAEREEKEALRAEARATAKRAAELEARLRVQGGEDTAPAPVPSASMLNAPLGVLALGEAAALALVVPALCKARNTSAAIAGPDRELLKIMLDQRELELKRTAADLEARGEEALAAARALEQTRKQAAITEAEIRREAERRIAEAKLAASSAMADAAAESSRREDSAMSKLEEQAARRVEEAESRARVEREERIEAEAKAKAVVDAARAALARRRDGESNSSDAEAYRAFAEGTARAAAAVESYAERRKAIEDAMVAEGVPEAEAAAAWTAGGANGDMPGAFTEGTVQESDNRKAMDDVSESESVRSKAQARLANARNERRRDSGVSPGRAQGVGKSPRGDDRRAAGSEDSPAEPPTKGEDLERSRLEQLAREKFLEGRDPREAD